ncbi:MAG: indolepyruvate ferredoxin oxidoreductase [Tannerella sp.]|jgi:indolepyruvate ferredoxin oxidoreductase alpha subunit|nr:indolepyruvate ferredoxin oxidoreductase [Tannerella sp.]
MEKILLLGDEAIAQAAMDAGLSGVYAYPGTPSTEITEYIQNSVTAREKGIFSDWCTNEKTALEAALGMSYAGKRALSCMKHVGLNVAADCFMNAAISGIHGGLIVVVADDPSMHSSQNEQDSRIYGDFAMLPILEPANQQEAYDMVYDGFGLSEKIGYPILVRITTRLAHSRTGITTRPPKDENQLSYPIEGRMRFTLLPALARIRYKKLLDAQKYMLEESEISVYNQYFDSPDTQLGIITAGIAFNYLSEFFPDGFGCPVLKIGQYPLPVKQIEMIAGQCDTLLILEDGYPVIESQLKGLLGKGLKIRGRLDGTLPRAGELNPDMVGKALGKESKTYFSIPEILVKRPPMLCQGCGHRDLFEALNEAVKTYETPKVFGDIGCYTLGALPPFLAIDSCIDMGAAITMAKGASDAGVHPSIGVIGDSTFAHSGMTGLLDCVNANSHLTIIILDNETTGMTGGQNSSCTGRIESICAGIGVAKEHIRVIIPLKKNHDEMVKTICEEIEYHGVSVIIARRECIQTIKRNRK